MTWEVLNADCIEAMREMDEASVDAIVTDPPYGLEFMGKEWDRLSQPGIGRRPTDWVSFSATGRQQYAAPNRTCGKCGGRERGAKKCDCERPEWKLIGKRRKHYDAPPDKTGGGTNQHMKRMQQWHQAWATEALRVLRPGGHLLAFGGTRTYHRLACAIEDAGFEIRDSVMWIYGQGFPKSRDVSKDIDKRPGVSRHAEFATHLRESMKAKGYTNTFDVAEAVVGRRTGAVANWQKYQWPEAKWWPALRDLLDMDPAWDAVIAEAERQKTGERGANLLAVAPGQNNDRSATTLDVTAPATPEGQRWQGWGTALKPAHEPIVVARKPLIGTVAANVLEHGTGALNVDGCRIEGAPPSVPQPDLRAARKQITGYDSARRNGEMSQASGRWPANVALSHLPDCERVGTRRVKGSGQHLLHHGRSTPGGNARTHGAMEGVTGADHVDPDGLETVPSYRCAPGCPVAELDRQSGESRSSDAVRRNNVSLGSSSGGIYGEGAAFDGAGYGDTGGASRFFYTAKASRAERNAGLDGFPPVKAGSMAGGEETRPDRPTNHPYRQNHHPTVKPIDLMRWLVRLVTPPNGTVLDPFVGSGTTGCAAVLEGFDFIGVEREAEYVDMARARITWWSRFEGKATDEILIATGYAERIEAEHRDAGQLGLFG